MENKNTYNTKIIFSVVIPVYNAEEYLKDCIESVIRQDFPDFEVILVDDGSTDNSADICDKYAKIDARVHVIHKRNEGAASARKYAINEASGKYIACLDADDWIDNGLFFEAFSEIQKYAPDVLVYGMKVEDLNGCITVNSPYRKGYYNKKNLEEEIYPILIQSADAKYFHAGLCGAIFQRELLIDNLFSDKRVTVGEDQACLIPTMAKANSMFVLKGNYYNYRYNIKSETKGHKVLDWSFPKVANKFILSHIDINKYDFKEQLCRKIVHDIWNTAYTRFYGGKTYIEVSRDIHKHLNDNFYQKAIEHARFKNSCKALFMMAVLRLHFIPAMYVYSKIRKY